MTVAELIADLQREDPARIVVMSRDAEGNGYSPLASFWTGNYRDREVGLEVLTEDDLYKGYTEADILEGVPAVILSPV